MPESRDAGLKCGAKCATLSLSKCMPEMWDGVVRILEGSYAKIVPKTKRESCAVCYAKCVPESRDAGLKCGAKCATLSLSKCVPESFAKIQSKMICDTKEHLNHILFIL